VVISQDNIFLLLCTLTHRAGGQLVINASDFITTPPGQLRVTAELDGSIVLQYGDAKEACGGRA
jgi:hypothetical protein